MYTKVYKHEICFKKFALENRYRIDMKNYMKIGMKSDMKSDMKIDLNI